MSKKSSYYISFNEQEVYLLYILQCARSRRLAFRISHCQGENGAFFSNVQPTPVRCLWHVLRLRVNA